MTHHPAATDATPMKHEYLNTIRAFTCLIWLGLAALCQADLIYHFSSKANPTDGSNFVLVDSGWVGNPSHGAGSKSLVSPLLWAGDGGVHGDWLRVSNDATFGDSMFYDGIPGAWVGTGSGFADGSVAFEAGTQTVYARLDFLYLPQEVNPSAGWAPNTVYAAGSTSLRMTQLFPSDSTYGVEYSNGVGGINRVLFTSTPVPEPSSVVLGGLAMFILLRRRC